MRCPALKKLPILALSKYVVVGLQNPMAMVIHVHTWLNLTFKHSMDPIPTPKQQLHQDKRNGGHQNICKLFPCQKLFRHELAGFNCKRWASPSPSNAVIILFLGPNACTQCTHHETKHWNSQWTQNQHPSNNFISIREMEGTQNLYKLFAC